MVLPVLWAVVHHARAGGREHHREGDERHWRVVVTPAVQYAAVRRANPGAAAELDATGTTGTAMFAATLATSGTSWAQLGVGVKLSQGTYGRLWWR
jgi:hypothetical protein